MQPFYDSLSIVNQILRLFDTKLLVEFGNRRRDANDIDILIISDEFEGISKLRRKELINNSSNAFLICLFLSVLLQE